ncbi:hypothetical protein DD238_006419 [Peronospora effusa]|uniref:PWWP domain-containing protein n=1 Tax=Peronospora effusa TaxID=542832 RepID=A0A3M6VF73_9STRA|nr:hypothetical protein DD238_006419 [Peronospora effusa]RQM14002.1 hypothetical protein DD237_006536 [Peronospora effusa]
MSEQDIVTVSTTPIATNSPPNTEVKKESEEKKILVDTSAGETTLLKPVVKQKAAIDVDKTVTLPAKRRTPSPRMMKKSKESDIKVADGEDTESEPEKPPKKRVKTTKKTGKPPGRKKKVVVVESEEDHAMDEQMEAEKKVNALSDEIKSRFGQIVWAKMGGYPYWPCIITDPRLLPSKLQETALKVLETKYLVFFYVSNNFAPVSFKRIESWDDTKFKYREGHPEKDSKAPKRRVKLMEAIEEADKETKLPIEERANGLVRPIERAEKPVEMPAPAKRKPGRPPKNKTAGNAAPKSMPKKRQKKGDDTKEMAGGIGGKEAMAVTTQEEEEDATGSTLSKEEIKAKVASRKTPKKKGTDDSVNAAGASVKKALKVIAKHGKLNGSAEIDSKRKKEIELVVPHKTVKSADIREMTEEAARKKLSGPRNNKKKDKGAYQVGDLASFASKMARLHAKESARNNDELVGMMEQLFKETLMYRSDVERSGLAAIIAILRKSLSPTVGQTASALRKHMIDILEDDTDMKPHLGKKPHEGASEHGTKKRKAENGSSVKPEEQQQSLVDSSSLATANTDVKENVAKAASLPVTAPPTKEAEDALPKEDVVMKMEQVSSKPVEVVPVKVGASNVVSLKAEHAAKIDKPTADKRSSSLDEKPGNGVMKDHEDILEVQDHVDKNRITVVDMLRKILDNGKSKGVDVAKEIEAALFERFKETNDDYLAQARIIIFGLKENAPMRDRLFSGAMHCLEFAYADDAFFSTTTE